MFGIEARDARDAGGLRKFVEGSVAFAQGDDLLLGLRRGKKLAESPYAAEVDSFYMYRAAATGISRLQGFEEFQNATRLISSKLPHCEQRKS